MDIFFQNDTFYQYQVGKYEGLLRDCDSTEKNFSCKQNVCLFFYSAINMIADV